MRVALLPYTLSPDEQHHVANLCRSLTELDPSVSLERFDRGFPMRSAPADVIHVHWPEHVLDNRGVAKYLRPVRQLASIRWCRRRGAVVVHTAHNAAPHDHEPTRFGRWYLDAFDRSVDVVLASSEAGNDVLLAERPALQGATFEFVPLGLPLWPVPTAIDRLSACRRYGLDPTVPVVAFVGRVMRYKGIDALCEIWDPNTTQLLIAGAPDDAELAGEITTAVGGRPGARLDLRRLKESELVDAVGAATVVVLPFVKILNSGSALLALSLGRRVLVPDLPTFRELRAELGERWVHLFVGARPSAEELARALEDIPDGRPDLSAHEWSAVSGRTLAAYRSAIDRRSA